MGRAARVAIARRSLAASARVIIAAMATACAAPSPTASAPTPGAPAVVEGSADSRTETAPASGPSALLPRASPPLAPAQTELAGVDEACSDPNADPNSNAGSARSQRADPNSDDSSARCRLGDTITETESCAGCHADAAAQWRSSAHAFGSFNNPIYRVVVDRFRAEVGRGASRFCAGCHDVALLVDGAMSGEVTPADPRGHGGVTCRVCHGIEQVRPDGNGSYALSWSPIPVPRDGDDESLRAHKARMALPPLRTASLCGACHRAFLSPDTGNAAHLVGQDELGAWQRSAYAGSLAARVDEPVDLAECRTCHMPLEAAPRGDAAAKAGSIHSHRFAGANTWLAAMRGDGAQVRAAQAMLQGAASLDVAAVVAADGSRTLPADGAPVRAGEPLVLDVVVRNERVGHRFPGGVLDAQDTWIELVVQDARGARLAEAGTAVRDPTRHRLRAVQGDSQGAPLLLRETQRFRAPVYNHTVAPRDAEVVRYRFDVPARLPTRALPLQVTARLRHRSRELALARAACADAATSRGAAFAREVAKRTGARMDPCVPEPVTDVATARVWLGEGSPPTTSAMPAWRRLYDHGLGLLRAQQEEVDAARPSLERALELLPPDADRERATVLHALAEMAIREGRTDEALQRLDDAQAKLPDHPAIAHARGEALGAVWRWREAALPLRQAALASPLDDVVWSHLAVAYGSADDPSAALDAASRGLSLSPRDADLLRVQALALERLGAPAEDVARARDAFARWRPPDDAPAVRSACSRRFAWCALERIPVHVHPMRQEGTPPAP
jgi:tetratricopeptide (TPR) repeat protein